MSCSYLAFAAVLWPLGSGPRKVPERASDPRTSLAVACFVKDRTLDSFTLTTSAGTLTLILAPVKHMITPTTIETDAAALIALGKPRGDSHLSATSKSDFPLSNSQKACVRKVQQLLKRCWVQQAQSLDQDQLERLHQWLETRKHTFENALNNKVALHFDLFVLGIVSTITSIAFMFIR